MANATLTLVKIVLWRLWDGGIKLAWAYIPQPMKQALWRLISSQQQIATHVDQAMRTSAGVVVQVGSNDGISNDPLYASILQYKRRSVLIEPLTFLSAKLLTLHKDHDFVTVLSCAIHPSSDRVDFFYLPETAKEKMGPEWKSWYDQIGSFSREHILSHARNLEPFIETSQIECRTLDAIFDGQNIEQAAILHIDAEGFDLEVLDSLDLKKHRPHMVLIEQKHTPMLQLMKKVVQMAKLNYASFIYHDDIVFVQKA